MTEAIEQWTALFAEVRQITGREKAKSFLANLPPWDGVPRIDAWLSVSNPALSPESIKWQSEIAEMRRIWESDALLSPQPFPSFAKSDLAKRLAQGRFLHRVSPPKDSLARRLARWLRKWFLSAS